MEIWSMFIAGFVATSVKQLFVANILLFVTLYICEWVSACVCVIDDNSYHQQKFSLAHSLNLLLQIGVRRASTHCHKSMDNFGTLHLSVFFLFWFGILLFTLWINVSESKLMLMAKVPIKFLYNAINATNDYQRMTKRCRRVNLYRCEKKRQDLYWPCR